MKTAPQIRVALPFLLACWTATAQTSQPVQTMPAQAPAREVALLEGRGELIQFDQDIQKVAIAEPKIADAVVVSPREVMVNAKAPGRTTLVVWETGAAPARFEVTVLRDAADWDDFRRQVQDSVPGRPINVSGSGETVVLTGTVNSAEESRRAASVAQTRAKNVINLLEAPPPAELRQILLQVKFASVDRVALSEVGFNLFSTNDKLLGMSSTQQFQSPRISPLQGQGGIVNTPTVNFADLLNLFAFRPDLGIGATIKLLQDRNLLQILAEPNLITLEGKEASFLAGGSFPFPTLTTTSTGGAVSPVVTVQFKPFGVKLEFTPTITPSGAIQLKVAPEVSSLDYANAVTLQGFLIPALSQRRAETEVILKDGESFAIAGLIDNRVIETMSKVPGFGDVPVLGRLFRSRSSKKSTDELLVVITPHFVRPLPADEQAKLPEMPQPFLPTVVEEKNKAAKKHGTNPPPDSGGKAEYVGPRGHQEPK